MAGGGTQQERYAQGPHEPILPRFGKNLAAAAEIRGETILKTWGANGNGEANLPTPFSVALA
jgi:hypothetical protein